MNPNQIIAALLKIASAAWQLCDNAETTGKGDRETTTVLPSDFAALSDTLDVLDTLPDDKPGVVLSGPARAAWALESFLAGQETYEDPKCQFCDLHVASPCETAPPDICEAAINATHDPAEMAYQRFLRQREVHQSAGAKFNVEREVFKEEFRAMMNRYEQRIVGLRVPIDLKELKAALMPCFVVLWDTEGRKTEAYEQNGALSYLAGICIRYDRAMRALTNAGWTDLGGQEWQPPLGQRPLTDAEINEATMDRLGKWPSFEAQSWACKVVKALHLPPLGQRPAAVPSVEAEQASAWNLVFNALKEVQPAMMARNGKGQELAVAAIRYMAQTIKDYKTFTEGLETGAASTRDERDRLLTIVADLSTDGRRFRTLMWLFTAMQEESADVNVGAAIALMNAMAPVGIEEFRSALDAIAMNGLVPDLPEYVINGALQVQRMRSKARQMADSILRNYRSTDNPKDIASCLFCNAKLPRDPEDTLDERHGGRCVVNLARHFIEHHGE